MKPVLTAVAATSPEVIYYPIFTAEGGSITAQIQGGPGPRERRSSSARTACSPPTS